MNDYADEPLFPVAQLRQTLDQLRPDDQLRRAANGIQNLLVIRDNIVIGCIDLGGISAGQFEAWTGDDYGEIREQ